MSAVEPILHKILRGEGAERFLPFALSRMRTLEGVFGRDNYFRQNYVVEGYSVEVQQQPPYQYIRIVASDALFFEFQSTGWPVRLATGRYKVAVVSVEIKNGALDATLMGNQRVIDAASVSVLGREQQEQLIDEPVSYPGPKANGVYPRALYQTWAPKHSHTGLYLHGYVAGAVPWTVTATPSSLTAHFTRDVGYDVPWADGQAKNPLRYSYLSGTSDWPRASGVRLVKSDTFGDREFAIVIDAFDQVSVYPTSAITAFAGTGVQNVLPLYVQRTRIALPAWVYAKSERFLDFFTANPGNTGVNDFPEYAWKIHPDGEKAVAVVYERVAAEFDEAHYAPWAADDPMPFPTKGPLPFFPTPDNFATMSAALTGVYPQLGVMQETTDLGATRYLCAPGLIEITIHLAITGTAAEDYTFSVTVNTLRRPTTAALCPLVAGYVFHDVLDPISTPALKVYRARRGDLVVLDIECYGRLSDSGAASLMSVKNLTAGTELLTFGADTEHRKAWSAPEGMATTFSQLLAFDMNTLSFAILHRHRARTLVGDTFDGITTQATHFGVGIYVMGKYKTTLWPETIDAAAKLAIQGFIEANGRDLVAGLDLMPLNDLRGWGDADMDSLRENYDRRRDPDGGGFFDNPPHALVDPLANMFMDSGFGFKYYDLLVQEHPDPTPAAFNWWYACLGAGRYAPFLLFNLTDPRPGWYQHMAEIMSRLRTSPWTTFFAHPNGSWAFYNQEFIYNRAGFGIHQRYDGYIYRYTSTVPMSVANFEHCILDHVHLESKKHGFDSTFVALYDIAVNKAITHGTILDDAAPVSRAQLSALFSVGFAVDPYDATVTYQTLNARWHGFDFRGVDLAYWTGTKQAPRLGTTFFVEPNYDLSPHGILQNVSLSGFWQSSDLSEFLVPALAANPAQFSSCVMISG